MNAILKAAESLVLEAGHAGFSFEAVARRAHAGKPTIYRWWPNKFALLKDIYERRNHGAAPIFKDSLEEDIAACLTQVFNSWSRGSGQILQCMFAEAVSAPLVKSSLRQVVFQTFRQMETAFTAAISRGEVHSAIDVQHAIEIIASYSVAHLLVADAVRPNLNQVASWFAHGMTAGGVDLIQKQVR